MSNYRVNKNTSYAAHYSVVLLKDKTGSQIMFVFEKAGQTEAKVSDYQSQKKGDDAFTPSGKSTGSNTPVHRPKF